MIQQHLVKVSEETLRKLGIRAEDVESTLQAQVNSAAPPTPPAQANESTPQTQTAQGQAAPEGQQAQPAAGQAPQEPQSSQASQASQAGEQPGASQAQGSAPAPNGETAPANPQPAAGQANPTMIPADQVATIVDRAVSARMASLVAQTGLQGDFVGNQAQPSNPQPAASLAGQATSADRDAEAIWNQDENIRAEFIDLESFKAYLVHYRQGHVQAMKRPRE